ncbi:MULTISPECIES: hypothetical protein [unclassified Phenylobacterium]|uniref:hypothetical protein n=1 Tax=unclassified Phenylobacterium TaxID=2640670 RepID=UPI000839DAEE|nr:MULTISPECIES: hypothetical protein [unclassified Phenylobacterium]
MGIGERARRFGARVLTAGMFALAGAGAGRASDHLDSAAVVADPAADIGDVYAWMSPDAKRLNLAMTIVGKAFSDRHAYVFHVDSGPRFGATQTKVDITCRFDGATADCRVGGPKGLAGAEGRMRVFAGPRDDPFFNNVLGTRDAYDAAGAALRAGAAMDRAGCPAFDADVSRDILRRWGRTEGGPAKNLLAGWTPAALVVSVDVETVAPGGRMLAVWAETATAEGRIDRMGRPLTGNALLGTLGPPEAAEALKTQYNRATPADSDVFVGEIEKSLGLYDGFDGECGNAWLADAEGGPSRYLPLATLLADDRLWVNGASGTCTELFAVERSALSGRRDMAGDCGGRTPNLDAMDAYRALLVNGTTSGVSDGVDRDEIGAGATFPFLAAPGANR